MGVDVLDGAPKLVVSQLVQRPDRVASQSLFWLNTCDMGFVTTGNRAVTLAYFGTPMTSPAIAIPAVLSPTEEGRYQTLLQTMRPWAHLFEGEEVLDYGASWGTSTLALLELGARAVVGVDIDADRIARGRQQVPATVTLRAVEDTRCLPFPSRRFARILANAVVEHIPQPRTAHLVELWRVLAPGGYLVVNETPNSLYPRDLHTTGLWGNHWLPKSTAYRRAIRHGRFNPARTDWDSSGWRGAYYWEIARHLVGAILIPETIKPRHRVLTALGLPASMFDPYPTWVFQKSHVCT